MLVPAMRYLTYSLHCLALPSNQLVHDFSFTQPAITCSNLTIETLEQGVKYVQS